MAEVWAARVEGPGGFVKSLALKFILESFAGDAELERLFFNEARVAARMSHANLVAVFDFDRIADPEQGGLVRHYIAMERVEGHDLRRVLQMARHKDHPLTGAIALHVAGEVLKGLRYVHELRDPEGTSPLGLVHRDVSPHNVLVGMAGEVKLSDFGIAKARTQSLGTLTGMVRGKLAYASPEQLRGQPADHRSDQFAAGIALWEMLASRRLFGNAAEQEIIRRVLRCEVPPLPVEAEVDPRIEDIVRRMLSPAPDDRYPSTAAALAAVLAAPGYTANAEPLGELMRALFETRVEALPPTLPVMMPAPLAAAPTMAAAAAAATYELHPDSDRRPGDDLPTTLEPPRSVMEGSSDSALIASWWISSESPASEGAKGADDRIGLRAGEGERAEVPLLGSPPGRDAPAPPVATAAKTKRPSKTRTARVVAPRRRAAVKADATTLRLGQEDVTGSAYVSAAGSPAMRPPWSGWRARERRVGRRVFSVCVLLLGGAAVSMVFIRRSDEHGGPQKSGTRGAEQSGVMGLAGSIAPRVGDGVVPSRHFEAPPVSDTTTEIERREGPRASDSPNSAGSRGHSVSGPEEATAPRFVPATPRDPTGHDFQPPPHDYQPRAGGRPRENRPSRDPGPGAHEERTPPRMGSMARTTSPADVSVPLPHTGPSVEPPVPARPRSPVATDTNERPTIATPQTRVPLRPPPPTTSDANDPRAPTRNPQPPSPTPTTPPPGATTDPRAESTSHPPVTHPPAKARSGVPANGAPILE